MVTFSKSLSGTYKGETTQSKTIGDGLNTVITKGLGDGGNLDGRRLTDILVSLVEDLEGVYNVASGSDTSYVFKTRVEEHLRSGTAPYL